MKKILKQDMMEDKKSELSETQRAELRAKYHDRIQNLTLMDDEFMVKVFENDLECTGLVLEIILGKKLKIISSRGQKPLENLQGHSVRLDIAAVDDEGRKYDIEIQRSDKGASEKRARFYSSIIDANELVKQEEYGKLSESCVIFITENDVLKSSLPIYHIERVITETGELFNDGSHIIYVNAERDDAETELGKLMHDFKCSNPEQMNYRTLKDKTGRFKQPSKEEHMCRAFEEVKEEGRQQGRMEGRLEGKLEGERNKAVETARNFLKMGLTAEQIAQGTGLSIEEISSLKVTEES